MKTPSQEWSSNLVRVVWIATSSARMMVRVSSLPAASMYMVVRFGICTTAAPRRECLLISKSSVYTYSFGENLGCHGMGLGSVAVPSEAW